MTTTPCPNEDSYSGPELSTSQFAEIMMSSHLRGRAITDPTVHEEMREGWAGGARPAREEYPCLMWGSERKGIRYQVGHNGEWKMLTWSALAAMDSEQLDLFEEMS